MPGVHNDFSKTHAEGIMDSKERARADTLIVL
jgi:hypothetical protein